MSRARDVRTARRAGTGTWVGVGEGCVGVFGAVGESGLGVTLGLGVAEGKVTGSSAGSVGAAGAQADKTKPAVKSRDDQKGSRKLSSIFYLLSSVRPAMMNAFARTPQNESMGLILIHDLTNVKGLFMTPGGGVSYISMEQN